MKTEIERLKMKTNYAGIDYGLGRVNSDSETGIRFGVIPHQDVGSWWYETSESDYGEPTCPKCGNKVNKARKTDYHCPQCKLGLDSDEVWGEDPICFYLDDGEYKATQGADDCDIFILKSPYYTRAQFCSPCAPGAGYLRNECETGPKTFCFGHDCFEDGKAPYTVYSVKTGEVIAPENFVAVN